MLQEEIPTKTVHPRRRSPSILLITLFIVFQILVISVSFMGGYIVHDWRFGDPLSKEKFPLLNEAYGLLEENAYFPLPTNKTLEYGMISGMLESYNEPFTVFVKPPQHALQSQQLAGKYGGIGVRIERDGNNNIYIYPLPNSPAISAGVKDGDRLFKAGALVITSKTTNDELEAAIRGTVGQKVTITIGHRPDYAPFEVSIERQEVALPSTTWNLAPAEPSVGIVHVQVIADTTPDEVTRAIKDLKGQGAKGFIIDVRNNGGGLVDAGVNFARLFLKNGEVIQEQYRGQPVKTFKVDRPGPFVDLPMVVLMNQGTASAAEIFAGAIQGQKRAPLIGTRSYGKDTIQLVFSLSDGSSLHVTSAHWWVPGKQDQPITGKGLLPDIPVSVNASDSQVLQTAIEALQK